MSTPTSTATAQHHHKRHSIRHNFANAKAQCLGKRDKSSAGRIDPHAVEICAVLNAREAFYTTSSCAGRCLLYQGKGIKATQQFTRFRVSHDKIHNAVRYFNLDTLQSDPSGGGDPIRSIGQFEHAERVREMMQEEQDKGSVEGPEPYNGDDPATLSTQNEDLSLTKNDEPSSATHDDDSIWLRFEPFILHVACRSLAAAHALLTAARPSFKNVGLTTWNQKTNASTRYLVAIWGDEGLEMPLTTPNGTRLFDSSQSTSWLASLVNERHERNWQKIDRFVRAVRDAMPAVVDDLDLDDDDGGDDGEDVSAASAAQSSFANSAMSNGLRVPRSFDVVGDVAILHSVVTTDLQERQQIGQAIMKKNKAIKVVVLRENTMGGTERAPGQHGFVTLAGASRLPLVTTHNEHGIKCVVDLEHTFFSPRMGPERLRICQQVARGEHVLVLFCGVGMDAMQIAGRTEASSIVAIELNQVAVKCARLGHRMLERNKAVKCVRAAERLEIIEGDVLEVVPTLQRNHFDRIVAPRPKEGALDGDLGTGEGGLEFLRVLLPVLKQEGGECHWYEFVADHEYPECTRSVALLHKACAEHGLVVQVIHVANAGSVAMRQLRVCIDFRVFPER